jgi:transcriptional regulator with XRE-family HTH domain
MGKNDGSDFAKFKVAYALNKLLQKNKKIYERNRKQGIEDLLLDHSYDKIASRTGLRIATISEVFNGKADPKFSTISLILQSLGVNYSGFGKLMDSVTEAEAKEYVDTKSPSKKIRTK